MFQLLSPSDLCVLFLFSTATVSMFLASVKNLYFTGFEFHCVASSFGSSNWSILVLSLCSSLPASRPFGKVTALHNAENFDFCFYGKENLLHRIFAEV